MKPRTKRWLIIGVPIAVVVIAAAIVLPLVLTGGPQLITLHGAIRVPGDSDGTAMGCAPGEGYSDITEGAAVRITAPDGSTLNTGSLTAPILDEEDGYCKLEFHVSDIPLDRDSYGVTISDRGTLMFSEQKVQDGNVVLQLG